MITLNTQIWNKSENVYGSYKIFRYCNHSFDKELVYNINTSLEHVISAEDGAE